MVPLPVILLQEEVPDPGVTTDWYPGLLVVLVIAAAWIWWRHFRKRRETAD